jgi:hypothetical protein
MGRNGELNSAKKPHLAFTTFDGRGERGLPTSPSRHAGVNSSTLEAGCICGIIAARLRRNEDSPKAACAALTSNSRISSRPQIVLTCGQFEFAAKA